MAKQHLIGMHIVLLSFTHGRKAHEKIYYLDLAGNFNHDLRCTRGPGFKSSATIYPDHWFADHSMYRGFYNLDIKAKSLEI